MIKQMISRVVDGHDLNPLEMIKAMELCFDDRTRASQVAALLVALRLKGETPEEIASAARVIRRQIPRIKAPDDVIVLDRDEINLDEETVAKTCSLDEGVTRTFNISTATALVAAGGGLNVVKFGARANSTFCGSANVVTELGVALNLTQTEVERCIKQVGIGFMYADLFLTPLALPTQVREEIGIRTIFNLVGPLANPADGLNQVLGVYFPERTELMCQVLQLLGAQNAMVLYGQDTLDELSLTGPTHISHLKNGTIKTYDLVPEDLGLTRVPVADISGGNAKINADIIRSILDGEPGPRRDVVLLNASAAFQVAGRAQDFQEGLQMAAESIDSGKASEKLKDLISFTSQCGVYQHKDVSWTGGPS